MTAMHVQSDSHGISHARGRRDRITKVPQTRKPLFRLVYTIKVSVITVGILQR